MTIVIIYYLQNQVHRKIYHWTGSAERYEHLLSVCGQLVLRHYLQKLHKVYHADLQCTFYQTLNLQWHTWPSATKWGSLTGVSKLGFKIRNLFFGTFWYQNEHSTISLSKVTVYYAKHQYVWQHSQQLCRDLGFQRLQFMCKPMGQSRSKLMSHNP